MKRLFALGAAMGAALAYFFDPETGNRRRSMTRDRVLAFFRRIGHQAGRAGQAAKSQAYGVTQKAVHLKDPTKEEPDDAPLQTKMRHGETAHLTPVAPTATAVFFGAS